MDSIEKATNKKIAILITIGVIIAALAIGWFIAFLITLFVNYMIVLGGGELVLKTWMTYLIWIILGSIFKRGNNE